MNSSELNQLFKYPTRINEVKTSSARATIVPPLPESLVATSSALVTQPQSKTFMIKDQGTLKQIHIPAVTTQVKQSSNTGATTLTKPVAKTVTITAATPQTSSNLPANSKPSIVLLQSAQPQVSSGQKMQVIYQVSGHSLLGQPSGSITTPAAGKKMIVPGVVKPGEPIKVCIPGATESDTRTYVMRKVAGTNTYTVDTTVKSSGLPSTSTKQVTLSTGTSVASTIPVGKVLPLHVSTSKPSIVMKTNNTLSGTPVIQSLIKTVQPVSAASSSVQTTKAADEKTSQGSYTSPSYAEANKDMDRPVDSPLPPLGPLSKEPSLIPMKITAVSDTGVEVSVSRDNIADSVTETEKGNGENMRTENTETDVVNDALGDGNKSKSCVPSRDNDDVTTPEHDAANADTEPVTESPVHDAANADTEPVTESDRITSAAESVSDDSKENKRTEEESNDLQETRQHFGGSVLQNVFARVYLAPEESASSNVEGKDNTSLKIGSVFSLNDDQKKALFPENNNNGASIVGTGVEAKNESASLEVRIKQEPRDDKDGIDDNQNETADSGGVRIKEEPQSPSDIKIKQEPKDDYEYSNYPIPDDEESSSDDSSESTDTATEDSPKKIKEEPKDDDESKAKDKSERKIRLSPRTAPETLSSTPVVTTPTTESSPPAVTAKATRSSPPAVKTPVSPPPPASASSWLSLFAQKKAGVGNTIVLGGKGLAGKPLANGIVTDACGKKYIIVSPPEKRSVKLPTQGLVKGPQTNKATPRKSYIVTMSNGQKRLIHLPHNAPASTLLASLVKGNSAKTLLTTGSQQQKLVFKSETPTLKPSTSKTTLADVKSKVKSTAPSTMKASETEANDENRRRSSRERRSKRRYSPPPIGPRKRQYACVSPPVLKKESDDKSSDDTENSSGDEKEHERDGGAEKMELEPTPLTPAVVSREERMRLLKDLIREKEAALEEMRKKREQEKADRENDPDLMDL